MALADEMDSRRNIIDNDDYSDFLDNDAATKIRLGAAILSACSAECAARADARINDGGAKLLLLASQKYHLMAPLY